MELEDQPQLHYQKKRKRGSHTYGWLQLPRATKHIKCRAGQYCKGAGLIRPGERYVSIARWRMPYKRLVSRGPQDELESYDTSPVGIQTVGAKVVPTRLHFSCLVDYLNFMADRQEAYRLAHPSKGRPVGAGDVALLTPAIRQYRKSLVRKRSYLAQKLISEADPIAQLNLCYQLLDNRNAIAGTGVPLQETLSRKSPENSQMYEAAVERHRCHIPPLHYLDSDLKCQKCPKQYSRKES